MTRSERQKFGARLDRVPSEVTAIRKAPRDKVVVQDTASAGRFGIALNQTVKPFTDVRVRKALTLAIDRYTASEVLYSIASPRDVGGLMRPGTEWGLPEGELLKLPGPLVGTERCSLGEGEELRRAAESLLEPESSRSLAQRGLGT